MKRIYASLTTISLTAIAGLSLVTAANAQTSAFPVRPVRILIPFAAGGGTDIVARIVGKRLGEQIGQPIVVEPKPGAGGAIAVAELMRAEPDGHTLLLTTSSHATLPALQKLSWEPADDFTPIARVYSYPFALVAATVGNPVLRSVDELVSYARARPGALNWGSSGNGGPQHLAGEEFMRRTGLRMVHVPYRGNGPMLQALVSGEIHLMFDTQTLVIPQAERGRALPLAIAADERSRLMPAVPTLKEAGIDFAVKITNFVIAPKGVSDPVQRTLNREIASALEHPEVKERLISFGHDVPVAADNTPQSVAAHIKDFAKTYGSLVVQLGIKAD